MVTADTLEGLVVAHPHAGKPQTVVSQVVVAAVGVLVQICPQIPQVLTPLALQRG